MNLAGRTSAGSPLLRAVAMCLLVASSGCGGSAPVEQPSFLLVSLDTTRANQMGLYGYGRPTTPRIDALAARGLVFDRAYTVAPHTLRAHASLFTGLLPETHQVHERGDGRAIPLAARTLAEDFRAAGYQTAGFAAHGDWLSERFGMDRGFEQFSSAYGPAQDVFAEASRFLRERDPERPFFLFVHLFDAHSDWNTRAYDAPDPFDGRFTEGYDGPLGNPAGSGPGGSELLHAISKGAVAVAPEDIEYLRAEYDEGVAALDAQLGSFLDAASTELGQAYVVLTSDHGEAFMEHGEMLHGTLHDEVMRIPLVLLPPSGRDHPLGAPRRITQPISLVDLRPTLLGLAALPEPTLRQGTDWTDWLSGRAGPPPTRPMFLASQGVYHQGLKYFNEGGAERLFDLDRDPGEQRNLLADPEYADRREALKRLISSMHVRIKSLRTVIAADGLGPAPGIDDEMRERLAALGYVDLEGEDARVDAPPLASAGGPSTDRNENRRPTLDGYTQPVATYFVGAAVQANDPLVSGGRLASFRVTPPLPPGLTIDPDTGRIEGTPTASSTERDHLVTARSPSGALVETLISTTVARPRLRYPAWELTFRVGEPCPPLVPELLGPTPDEIVIRPDLPAGLQLDGRTGVLSGTPTGVSARRKHMVVAYYDGRPPSSSTLFIAVEAHPR